MYPPRFSYNNLFHFLYVIYIRVISDYICFPLLIPPQKEFSLLPYKTHVRFLRQLLSLPLDFGSILHNLTSAVTVLDNQMSTRWTTHEYSFRRVQLHHRIGKCFVNGLLMLGYRCAIMRSVTCISVLTI